MKVLVAQIKRHVKESPEEIESVIRRVIQEHRFISPQELFYYACRFKRLPDMPTVVEIYNLGYATWEHLQMLKGLNKN